MKRLLSFALLFLSAMSLLCYAGNRVRGELRTEPNGFQWYCYINNRTHIYEAYSVDGTRLFGDVESYYTEFITADKNDEGLFVVKIRSCGNRHYGYYYDSFVYSPQGKFVKNLGTVEKVYRVKETFANPSKVVYYTISEKFGEQYLYYDNNKIEVDWASHDKLNNWLILNNSNSLFKDYKRFVRWDGYEISKLVRGYEVIQESNMVIANIGDEYEILDSKGNILCYSIKNVHHIKTHNLLVLTTKDGDGLLSYSGQWIIKPQEGYKSFEIIAGNYLKFKYNGYYGIMTMEGEEIVPVSRTYTSISYDDNKELFSFTRKGVSGYLNTQGKEISTTQLLPTYDEIKTDGNYSEVVTVPMSGGKNYYIVCKNQQYGFTDSYGRIIVPLEMNKIEQCGEGFLRFKIGDYWGVMDYQGKTIIPTTRGYTSIGNYISSQKIFPYTMYGYKGECDNTGKQLSKIQAPISQSSSSTSSNTSSKNSSEAIVEEVSKDYAKYSAEELYNKSQQILAKSNHSTEDAKKALAYLKASAEKGYAKAQFEIAVLFLTQLKDYDQGMEWLEKAIEQGYEPAQNFFIEIISKAAKGQ